MIMSPPYSRNLFCYLPVLIHISDLPFTVVLSSPSPSLSSQSEVYPLGEYAENSNPHPKGSPQAEENQQGVVW